MPPLKNKPDPYNGFKNDRERRLALNTRVRSYSLAAVAIAALAPSADLMGRLRWLLALIH